MVTPNLIRSGSEQTKAFLNPLATASVWKKWKDIIPYIDDYRVAVSLDLYDYTGINFNVDVKTAEGDDEEDEDSTKLDIVVNKIAEELKNMMELGTTYISENSDISTRLEDLRSSGLYTV